MTLKKTPLHASLIEHLRLDLKWTKENVEYFLNLEVLTQILFCKDYPCKWHENAKVIQMSFSPCFTNIPIQMIIEYNIHLI